MRTLGTLLFPRFELLDVSGPVEILGNQNLEPPLFEVLMVAETAGLVASAQGPSVQADFGLDDCPPLDVLLVPGGPGTRLEVDNPRLRQWLTARAATAELVLSVCTGASLLARAGLLDGHRATTNKRSFDWVKSQGPRVEWVREARWVEDGRFISSSGVSAGMDMAVQVLSLLAGRDEAERIARVAEYNWQSDPSVDPFAKLYLKS
jgi:transcriptional regulator GlxA family with amidase domain